MCAFLQICRWVLLHWLPMVRNKASNNSSFRRCIICKIMIMEVMVVMVMMGSRMMMIILCLQTELGLVVHGKLDLRVAIGAIEDLINDIEVTRCEWIGDPKDFPLNESSESGSWSLWNSSTARYGYDVPNFLVKITFQLFLLQTSRNVLKHVMHKWGGHIWPFQDALRPQRL